MTSLIWMGIQFTRVIITCQDPKLSSDEIIDNWHFLEEFPWNLSYVDRVMYQSSNTNLPVGSGDDIRPNHFPSSSHSSFCIYFALC